MIVRANQGDTVDLMVWRVYGSTQGMNELVLEANQGLAALGAILPIGHAVYFPENPPQNIDKKIIQLWD